MTLSQLLCKAWEGIITETEVACTVDLIKYHYWRHNERDGVSNPQRLDCLLNRLFRCRSRKTSKLRVTGPLCGEFNGGRWIPRTRGQLRGKCFHLMTSSCHTVFRCFALFGCVSFFSGFVWFIPNIQQYCFDTGAIVWLKCQWSHVRARTVCITLLLATVLDILVG